MSEERTNVGGVRVATGHFINNERVSSPTTFEDRSPLDWSLKSSPTSPAGPHVRRPIALTAARRAFADWAALDVYDTSEVPATPGGPHRRQRRTHRDRRVPRHGDARRESGERVIVARRAELSRLRRPGRDTTIRGGGRLTVRTTRCCACPPDRRSSSPRGTRPSCSRRGNALRRSPSGTPLYLKPAEWSPLSCSLLMDLVLEAGFPPGVFNLVQGFGDEAGAALVSDPRVRRISFTGSPVTGRRIGESAAKNLVPFTAELGGKGPFVVYADADLDLAARDAPPPCTTTPVRSVWPARACSSKSPIRDEFLSLFTAADRATRPRRQPRPRDDDLPAHPPRAPAPASKASSIARRGRRHARFWRRAAAPRRLMVRADSHRTALQRRRDRPERGLRPGPHVPDVHGRGRSHRLANSTAYGLSATVFTTDEKRAERFGSAVAPEQSG